MQDKQKQYKRQNQWKRDTQDRIELSVPRGYKDKWKALAEAEGKSLTEFIVSRIEAGN